MIKPINNNILIKLKNNQKEGLLLVNDEVRNQAIVINISDEEKEIKVGTQIYFDDTEVFNLNNNQEYLIIHRSKVLGILEGGADE